MTVRTLLSLVGSQHELGDIIRTKRTSMADGRSLIVCDGEITVSKPLLDAVLQDGVHLGSNAHVKSSTLVKWRRAERWDMSDTNNLFIGISLETTMEFEHGTDGGTITTGSIAGPGGDVAINANGTKSILVNVETTSLDLELVYNEASARPATAVTLDTGQNYDSASILCLMSNDGEIIKVFAQSDNEDINIWTTTDGANGTWSEITPINPTNAATRDMTSGSARGNSTLTDTVWPTSLGLWISNDSCATFTEDVTLPDGDAPESVAITEAGIVYAVNPGSSSQVYKTTDQGANWTVLFDLGQQIRGRPGYDNTPVLTHVEVDSSDNIYVIGYSQPHTANAAKDSVLIWFSGDGGTTWTFSERVFVVRPDATGNNPIPLTGKDVRINAAGTRLVYTVNTSTDQDNLYIFTLTVGKFPPNIHEIGWKMVAD